MSALVRDEARGVTIEAVVTGEGPDVILLASALRGAEDFAQIQIKLARAGFRSLALNMRGVGQGEGPPGDFTLRDITDDIAGVIAELCQGPAHVVGHALGNILARATASYRPEMVRTVTVMPCGGHNLATFPVSDHVLHHFARCHQPNLSEEARRESLSIAFFALGNDPGSWLEGWWPEASGIGTAAFEADPETWWHAGDKPMLILHPLEDAMAPPAQGQAAKEAFGERAQYIEIHRCGHAILPEQPEFVANAIVKFLRARFDTAGFV
ncbi:MAG: alpha/beta hydrolase [Verrucomicrobiaceae bacterium]|nr:MAG: alpha/beta hydrolase [Verrucomicrobiaceae bacterium]